MPVDKLFNANFDLMQRALNLRSRKHEVVVSNVVNVDTPDYKAFDLAVKEALQANSQKTGNGELTLTHQGHLPPRSHAGAAIRPEMREVSAEVSLRGDGNTVILEKEMADLARNNLLYKATAQILGSKFMGLKNAIKGGGK
ncbi:MAG: flagellar basal body rod protein FlgB [Desulfosarcinaceae bacterium]|nr:flagellar basal body rod protein FlgB [Desulfosarcinaceae bacterium]